MQSSQDLSVSLKQAVLLNCERADLAQGLGSNSWSFVGRTKAELPHLTAQLRLGGCGQQESHKFLPRDGRVILSWLGILGREQGQH